VRNPWTCWSGGWDPEEGVYDVCTGLPDGADPADYPLPDLPEEIRQFRDELERQIREDLEKMVVGRMTIEQCRAEIESRFKTPARIVGDAIVIDTIRVRAPVTSVIVGVTG